jgi:hypothetical protein
MGERLVCGGVISLAGDYPGNYCRFGSEARKRRASAWLLRPIYAVASSTLLA